MNTYQERIRLALEATRDLRLMTMDPRHVEGYMRIDHDTLDGLSGHQFARLAMDCALDVLADPVLAEANAASMGLVRR